MRLYIFHHTQDCQDYNEHEVFLDLAAARARFAEVRQSIGDDVSDVYNEDEDEFYFETKYTQEKLYITEHDIDNH
jgi:hypothetical protein